MYERPERADPFHWRESAWSLRVPFIRALYDEGMKVGAIAKLLGCSYQVVFQATRAQRAAEAGDVEDVEDAEDLEDESDEDESDEDEDEDEE